jgi:hypothetical protein
MVPAVTAKGGAEAADDTRGGVMAMRTAERIVFIGDPFR